MTRDALLVLCDRTHLKRVDRLEVLRGVGVYVGGGLGSGGPFTQCAPRDPLPATQRSSTNRTSSRDRLGNTQIGGEKETGTGEEPRPIPSSRNPSIHTADAEPAYLHLWQRLTQRRGGAAGKKSGQGGIQQQVGQRQTAGGEMEDYKPPLLASCKQRVNISKESRHQVYLRSSLSQLQPQGLHRPTFKLDLRTLPNPGLSKRQIFTKHPVTPEGKNLKKKDTSRMNRGQ